MLGSYRVGAVFMVAVVLAGCVQEEGPLAPGRDLTPGPDAAQAALVCQVSVKAGSMACIPESPTLPDGVAGTVLGGQGEYVLLESSNVDYDEGNGLFSADVTVRNLLTQALGTADGASIDGDGVRVFFVEPPMVTAGSGAVSVANEDGQDTFIGSNSPYFKYAQVLTPGKVSLPRTWTFNVPSTVTTFTFKVYVAAKAADEAGIEPGLHFAARTISAGESHSCGLTLAGTAYCWGTGDFGRLGNGGFDAVNTPDSVHAPAGTKFVSISAGGNYTCGLASTGTAYCWGYEENGELGNGKTFANVTTPDSVHTPAGTKFIAISAAYTHTCGLVSTGAAYCWGDGYYGQLGNDGTDNVTTPDSVHAPAGTKFIAISAGDAHTCGITSIGAAYCWGLGQTGQLGTGTDSNESTPSPVLNVTNFALLAPRIPVDGTGRLLPARTFFEMYALAGHAGREPERCTTVHA